MNFALFTVEFVIVLFYKFYFYTLQCEVVYVDYGNKEVINKSSIMELPQNYANLGPFATRFWLIGYQAAPVPPAKLEEVSYR